MTIVYRNLLTTPPYMIVRKERGCTLYRTAS